ncbi:hypothetical protein NBRC110019_06060 [Neptunitalea chrysea]|uniref:Protein-export membrane protein SecG n=1 Tax=Neptunitalea chrysea TaxID=1647581 RepID=A0A9W6B589_9FLAO|nr:preprotein translocase subunit SecG [Neptunitalea chrysea]GLB51567.1 hypothetical protein NBRC110019_06060 [Neptunitalea chrysea]
MSAYAIYLAGIIIVSFLLILVVMVQNPKGGGLSSTFGGGANQIGGVKKTGDFLEKSTWVLSAIMVALILLANSTISGTSTDAKVLQGSEQIEGNLAPDNPATPTTPTNDTDTAE